MGSLKVAVMGRTSPSRVRRASAPGCDWDLVPPDAHPWPSWRALDPEPIKWRGRLTEAAPERPCLVVRRDGKCCPRADSPPLMSFKCLGGEYGPPSALRTADSLCCSNPVYASMRLCASCGPGWPASVVMSQYVGAYVCYY